MDGPVNIEEDMKIENENELKTKSNRYGQPRKR
jgi:hypothetical protein